MKKKKPYSERTDIEKIKTNWRKIKGLFDRKEWSSAIIRATTVAEIATNLAIREELQTNHNLKPKFVNDLLKWANGIQGKFSHLLLPVTKGTDRNKRFKKLEKKVKIINKVRNSIVHSGQFKNKKTATRIIEESKELIEKLVSEYNKGFMLNDIEKN